MMQTCVNIGDGQMIQECDPPQFQQLGFLQSLLTWSRKKYCQEKKVSPHVTRRPGVSRGTERAGKTSRTTGHPVQELVTQLDYHLCFGINRTEKYTLTRCARVSYPVN